MKNEFMKQDFKPLLPPPSPEMVELFDRKIKQFEAMTPEEKAKVGVYFYSRGTKLLIGDISKLKVSLDTSNT